MSQHDADPARPGAQAGAPNQPATGPPPEWADIAPSQAPDSPPSPPADSGAPSPAADSAPTAPGDGEATEPAGGAPLRRRPRRWWERFGTKLPAAVLASVMGLGAVGLWHASPLGRGCGGSDLPLEVAAAPDVAGILQQAARDYNRTGPRSGSRCVAVHVDAVAPGQVAKQLTSRSAVADPPDVWVPSSSLWGQLVNSRMLAAHRPNPIPGIGPSVATSPLVLAMPRPMAQALGWPVRQFRWADLYPIVKDRNIWQRLGHPEWGPFQIAKTDPLTSDAGLEAVVGSFYLSASVYGPPTISLWSLGDRARQKIALALERAPGPVASSEQSLLSAMGRADAAGGTPGFVSFLPIDERSVLQYNQGNPKVPLVAIYPTDGTLMVDHPYLTLVAPWVGADKEVAADDFQRYLRNARVQGAFQAAGFRGGSGAPGERILELQGLVPVQRDVVALAPPQSVTVDAAMLGWDRAHRLARLLSLIDVSASMNDPVPGLGKTKLELAKEATFEGLTLLNGDDEISGWSFGSDLGGSRGYRVDVPFIKLSRALGNYRHPERLFSVVSGLHASGGAPLYDTLLEAYRQMRAGWRPGVINVIVVMTDGGNTKQGGTALPQLLAELRSGQRERPLRVVAFGIGNDVDEAALRQITDATGGEYYHFHSTDDVSRAIIDAIERF